MTALSYVGLSALSYGLTSASLSAIQYTVDSKMHNDYSWAGLIINAGIGLCFGLLGSINNDTIINPSNLLNKSFCRLIPKFLIESLIKSSSISIFSTIIEEFTEETIDTKLKELGFDA